MDAKTGSIGAPSRQPQQGRSRASFERMIAAAEQLLRDRGSDDFTLVEVSKLGRVSIGSIYCRFDSKDALIRAIQTRVLAALQAEQIGAIAEAREAAGDLRSLLAGLIEAVAETLRNHAPMLRPLMLRASTDEVVQSAGRESYLRTAQAVEEAILSRRSEITHPDPDRAAAATFRIAYAAIARSLGLGSPAGRAPDVMDWHQLKVDLSLMSTSFLRIEPELVKQAR